MLIHRSRQFSGQSLVFSPYLMLERGFGALFLQTVVDAGSAATSSSSSIGLHVTELSPSAPRSPLFGERWKMGIENFSQKTMTTTMLTRPSHFLPHDDHGQAEPPTSIEIVLKNKDENVHNPYSSTGFPAESLSLQVLLFRHSLAAS